MPQSVTDSEARAALATAEQSRRHVIDEINVPRWYWWFLAAGWVGLGCIAQFGPAWLSVAATVAFGAAHATVAQRATSGRHRTTRLSVRADVVGRHVPALVIAGLLGLVALTVATALVLDADGARHPTLISSVFVAVLVLLGGPALMAAIRRRAARASTRS